MQGDKVEGKGKTKTLMIKVKRTDERKLVCCRQFRSPLKGLNVMGGYHKIDRTVKE